MVEERNKLVVVEGKDMENELKNVCFKVLGRRWRDEGRSQGRVISQQGSGYKTNSGPKFFTSFCFSVEPLIMAGLLNDDDL